MREARRIEINYAIVHALHGIGYCAVEAFAAVYLYARGAQDSQIGYMRALASVIAISTQMIASGFLDRYEKVTSKKVLTAFILLSIVNITWMARISNITMVVVLFAAVAGLVVARHGLLDSLMLEYINAGISADYGWPRSVGSFFYATSACVLGIFIQAQPTVTPVRVFLAATFLMMLFVWLMPPVKRKRTITEKSRNTSNYLSMLTQNKILTLFLIAILFSAIGHSAMGTYMILMIERAGGNVAHLGTTILIESGLEVPVFFLSGLIRKRWRCEKLLLISLVGYMIKLLLLALATSMTMIYAAVGMSFLCYGLFSFSSIYFANAIVGENDKAKAQALLALFKSGGLGGIIGNLMNGYLIVPMGLNRLLMVDMLFCIVGFGCMLVCYRRCKTAFA